MDLTSKRKKRRVHLSRTPEEQKLDGSIPPIKIRHVSGGVSELKFKAFQQGESSFQEIADFIYYEADVKRAEEWYREDKQLSEQKWLSLEQKWLALFEKFHILDKDLEKFKHKK